MIKVSIKQTSGFKSNVSLYVDGASRIKNNVITEDTLGAYSYSLEYQGVEKSGSYLTLGKTNNYNEIKALIIGLKAMNRYDIPVVAYSDSAYVVDCLQKGWWKKWEKNNWDKEGGLKNADLWKELITTIRMFDSFRIEKVKGHSTNERNNHVDYLNNKTMDNYLAGIEVKLDI